MYVTKQDDHQTELIELNVTFVRSLCVGGGVDFVVLKPTVSIYETFLDSGWRECEPKC